MLAVQHQLVLDEESRPIAVIIPFREWVKLQETLPAPPEPLVDLNEFAGCLSLGEEPVAFQRRLRDEWP